MLKSFKISSFRHRNIIICVFFTLISVGRGSMWDLIEYLKKEKVVTSDIIVRTMSNVDRKDYCPMAPLPYADIPQPIGYGADITAPRLQGLTLELLKDHLVRGNSALDVGSGSGYMTVCMGILLGDGGMSTGIEHIPQLAMAAYNNTLNKHKWLLMGNRVKYVIGDGRDGYKEHAPYDVIHAGASFTQVPGYLLEQLKPGGRFIGPTGEPNDQHLTIIDKSMDGKYLAKKLISVKFMPMQDIDDQVKEMHFRVKNHTLLL